jgi:hypothetical protein
MMANSKVNPLVRLLPSLTDVAFILPLVLLFGRLDGVKTLLGDGDTGWHVRTGQWILAHRAVPHKDLFSFTKPDAPWFAWEWLWDVAFAWLHMHGGLASVVVASILLICLTSALLFQLLIRNCESRIVAIVVTFLVVGGSSVHWLARPHLFTMFFVVIWLAVIDRAEKGRTRLLWLFPALTVLWTNLHGGFFVGILLAGTYAVGKLFESVFASIPEKRALLVKSGIRYLLVALACAAASFINPYTYHLHQHILAYLSDTNQLDVISEFQTLSFHAPPAIFFEIMLALAAVAAVYEARRGRITPVLLIAGWAHLALLAGRNIPLFLLISAPFVAATLNGLFTATREKSTQLPTWMNTALNTLHQISEEMTTMDQPWRIHAPAIVTALLLCTIVSGHAQAFKLRAEYDPKHYPAAALGTLGLGASDRRIFCDDEWGDYLAYRLYPTGRVFVDGRSDFYGGRFVRDYLDILGVKYNWEAQLDRYGVDTLLLSTKSAMAGAVKQSARWKVAYDDGTAILFEAATPQNRIFTKRGNKDGAEPFPSGIARAESLSFKRIKQ